MTWLQGNYIPYPITGTPGFPYRVDTPWRVLIHSTEGWKAEHALDAYKSRKSSPHLTVSYGENIMYQHIPLNLASYALTNLPGGVETNATRTIQIEIVGFAEDSNSWSDDKCVWLGEIIADIKRAIPDLRLVAPYPFVPPFTTNPTIPVEAWYQTPGVIGHQHAPENVEKHSDPGQILINKVLLSAQKQFPPLIPPAQADTNWTEHMRPFQFLDTNGAAYTLTEDYTIVDMGGMPELHSALANIPAGDPIAPLIAVIPLDQVRRFAQQAKS